MKINQQHLQQILNQVEHLDDEMLYSGLTILAKDLSEYIANAPSLQTLDLSTFQDVFHETMEEERSYWEQYGNNLFVPLADQKQPFGFAKSAVEGQVYDLAPLTKNSIHHEYFSVPGSKMFKRFAEKFKVTICEKGGPRDKFKAFVGKNELPSALASSILAGGFSLATFGYPIAVYVGLLIARTGLDVYCDPKKEEKEK